MRKTDYSGSSDVRTTGRLLIILLINWYLNSNCESFGEPLKSLTNISSSMSNSFRSKNKVTLFLFTFLPFKFGKAPDNQMPFYVIVND